MSSGGKREEEIGKRRALGEKKLRKINVKQ